MPDEIYHFMEFSEPKQRVQSDSVSSSTGTDGLKASVSVPEDSIRVNHHAIQAYLCGVDFSGIVGAAFLAAKILARQIGGALTCCID